MRRAKKVIRYEQRRSFTHNKVADNHKGSRDPLEQTIRAFYIYKYFLTMFMTSITSLLYAKLYLRVIHYSRLSSISLDKVYHRK